MTDQTDIKNQIRKAGLRYVYDDEPGISRVKKGRGFAYYRAGRLIQNKPEKQRLKALALPPAWKNVWISIDPDAHLLATGFDERGRKQYRYHDEWRKLQDLNKFDNMLVFGNSLPKIRRHVVNGLNEKTLSANRVICAVVRLLDTTSFRIGNEQYTQENNSYGLTTLRKKHVDQDEASIEIEFPGKGGKRAEAEINDDKLAGVIQQCEEIPGYRLFQYIDKAKNRNSIDSAHVNDWLKEKSGQDISAKDFRTWTACVSFLEEALSLNLEPGKSMPLTRILDKVADRLHNTPAILQKSYIHPRLISLYKQGRLHENQWLLECEDYPARLRKHEALFLQWLAHTG